MATHSRRTARGILALAFALAPMGAAVAGDAAAESERIVLRLADGMPSGHVIDRLIVQPFIRAVTEASGGQVEIRHFPAEQLGKSRDMLILTQTGVADIGYVIPSYTSDRMPLTAVTELPGIFQSTCQGDAALRALTREGGFLERHEFTPNGMRPLIIFLMPAYQLMLSTQRPLRDIRDLEGLKIRTPGGAMDLTVRGMGGVPIRMQPAELYESMSRGTVEGALLPYQSAVSYSLARMVRTGTIDQDFGTVAITFSMAIGRWNALPETVRRILAETGDRIATEACNKLDAAESAAREKLAAGGTRLVAVDAADRAAIEANFQDIRTRWASQLDRHGRPGSEALAAFTEAVAAAR